MSLDAGGLAQMTYNHNAFNGGIGPPTSGFASRPRANNVKRLSVAAPPKINTIDENQPSQPRTSRSHLLAGLRTAPKSPALPTSAPPTQMQYPGGLNDSRYATNDRQHVQQGTPQTATGAVFSNSYRSNQNQYNLAGMNGMYTPQQILAPPDILIGDEDGDSGMDPSQYEELVRTNQYLAQQKMRLQQQLIDAAQQFQNLTLRPQQSPYGQAQFSPGMGLYNQQLQNGVQPIVEAVPNQPGLYTVYNPMTGQANYFFDQSAQQSRNDSTLSNLSNLELSNSPPPPTPTFRAQVSPPPETQSPGPTKNWRSSTPPKTSSSPPRDEASPLPPPSANAFRPSHRKHLSLAPDALKSPSIDAPKTAGLKSSGFPPTPMTGTFGPGQAREGEHPLRQPRGPPSLDELLAKPTSKIEGSKNFATRQRRRAVKNLVRAGNERRGGASRGTGSTDSIESGTPTSERDITFSSSDTDTDSIRSGSASLSGKPSFGNLRNSPISAIGSERAELKERSRERNSVDSQLTAASVSSEEGSTIGGRLVEIKSEGPKEENKRKSTLLVLANAEKRRSQIY